ncbi:MAG: DUF2461 domain-containing protein [Chloroflexi bacterium]|nr:DUF2461 domain-containing protein [Chloroflexota bacterium]
MDFPALIAFLAELARHNNKPWFEEHRPTYERLRGEWLAFVGQVIVGIAQFDPSVGSVSPKDALFRINRDVRFAKDKRPYKTTFSAAICPQGRTSGLPAYYFHITEAGVLLVAGGVYMPEPMILGQIRQQIAEHPERLAAVLAEPAFAATFGTLEGERLKRPPQGYDETTPGIAFIKLKSFTASSEPWGWLPRSGHLADEIVTACRALFPLIRWLRAALTGSGDLGYLSPQEIDRLAGLGS